MSHRNHLVDALRAGARDGAPFADQPGGAAVPLAALWDRAARVAAALVAAGVTPGDRVAAQVEKSLAGVALYLGTLWAGAAFVPLNPAYTAPEMAYFLGDAAPKVLVCDPGARAALAPLAAGAVVWTLDADGAGLPDHAPLAAPVARGAEDLAAILYTSGTTGRPKGVMLSHGNLAANALALVAAWRFTAADRLIHALPMFHTHGLFVATHVALISGAALIFLPRFEPGAVLAALPRATALMGVPTFYTRLLDHPGLTRDICAGVRLFVAGSAPLLSETHAAWAARTGHTILERYGMTECGMIASNPYDGPRLAGTVGMALPGVELRVSDATGAALPPGEVGGVEVRGPNVFGGYWRKPDKTAEDIRPDGFFMTGDLGVLAADGRLTIVGRARDLIISGGFNVYPGEVEAAIDALPGVRESAVIGVPHRDFGEAVVALVVAAPGAEVAPDAVLAALAPVLARYKHPKRVLVVADLPRNAMGKVQKAALRAAHAGLLADPG